MLITSKDNNRIKEIRKLLNKKYSISKGLFVIEGENLIEEAIKNNLLIELYVLEEFDCKYDFKYDNVRIGYNSRLDTVQAAVLKVKLEAFKKYELQKRQEIAKMYSEKLNGKFKVPVIPQGFTSSFAQFTLIAETEEQRKEIIAKLKEQKIPAMIYYPIPMHLQTAFKNTPFKEEELEVSTKLCKTVFSIPMHPYLKKSDVDKIVNAFYNINKKD